MQEEEEEEDDDDFEKYKAQMMEEEGGSQGTDTDKTYDLPLKREMGTDSLH